MLSKWSVFHHSSVPVCFFALELGLVTYTTVPENTPARHRKRIICHIFCDSPNNVMATATPLSEMTRIGFRPKRSAARPQEIISIICVSEKSDSYAQNKHT